MHTTLNRALGIAWTILGLFFGGFFAWQLPYFYFLEDYHFGFLTALFTALCLLYLSGAVGGIFLFRGAAWARILTIFVSGFSLMLSGWLLTSKRPTLLAALLAIYSLLSLIILLLPRKAAAC